MFDPRLYREACRELRAPEDKIEEIITMTEKTKKRIRPLRTTLIAAAAVAMMVVSMAAANPEMVEDFTMRIASIIRVDKYRMDLTTEDGEKVNVYSIPEAAVEERDGRAILTLNGEDMADITDVLKTEGCYTYESTTDESRLIVRVEGTAKKWTAAVTIGDTDGPVYTFSSDSEGNGSASAPTIPSVTDDGAYVTTTEYDSETGEPISEEK